MKAEQLKPIYAWALIAVLACAVLAAFVNLQTGVLALLFIILGWWAFTFPREGFLFLVVIAPLLPMFKVTQTLGSITLLKDVLIGILFLRVVLVPLLTKRLPYRRNILWLPILFLTGWIGFDTLRAPGHALAILRARDLVMYMLLYFVAMYMPKSTQFYKRLLGWFLASATVTLLLGVYQWFFAFDSMVLRFDPVRQLWIPRVSSTFGHPSIFGQYVILLAAILAALAGTAKNKFMKLTWLIALAVTVPFTYFTYSRAVWFGYLFALAAIATILFTHKLIIRHSLKFSWRPLAVSGGVVLLFLILALRFTSAGIFLRTAIDPTYASNKDRLDFMTRLITSTTNTQAIIGSGLGNVVTQIFDTTKVTTTNIANGDARDVQVAKDSTLVDNQYLKTFVELGYMGLVIYAWLFWRLFKATISLSVFSKQSMSRVIATFALGFFAAFIIQALFIDIWDIVPTKAVFWILAGLVSRESLLHQRTS